ncbi:hypothetical protein BU212_23585 [Salmonella enterica subsp. enterica serovar Enteritidis]|nr:hypothetical protein [Salmonella enterica subsp. enterica serovar Muenchen]EDD4702361.1 hypothetical protein [Salmonella enterica subsp. enterica serovar Kentucky]EDD4716097.1 hypothetical protein [Salmonella enterica subsp. enterica serovar Montevideo]EDE4164821.1 hypothetical protein [Salmonella enterica subsp. enterica serovar Enteritidis]EDX2220951.1 hypothetical protein [Salmonella enterica subsp. enterica serovar 4,[5],12:i:-]
MLTFCSQSQNLPISLSLPLALFLTLTGHYRLAFARCSTPHDNGLKSVPVHRFRLVNGIFEVAAQASYASANE